MSEAPIPYSLLLEASMWARRSAPELILRPNSAIPQMDDTTKLDKHGFQLIDRDNPQHVRRYIEDLVTGELGELLFGQEFRSATRYPPLAKVDFRLTDGTLVEVKSTSTGHISEAAKSHARGKGADILVKMYLDFSGFTYRYRVEVLC